MKMEFSSQRREMLLFLTTNMAAVTSRANQQFNRRFCHLRRRCYLNTRIEIPRAHCICVFYVENGS